MTEYIQQIFVTENEETTFTIPSLSFLYGTRVIIDGIKEPNDSYTVTGNTVTIDKEWRHCSIVHIMAPKHDYLEEHGIGYNIKYEFEVSLISDGVPYGMVEWCGKNCKNKWGWHFGPDLNDVPSHEAPVMSFECDKDRFSFILVWGQRN